MSVLVISSSPRKNGNSDVLCDRFIQGAQESGHHTEKIRLDEMNISPCRACNACVKSHKCVINDDMAAIAKKCLRRI